MKGESKKKASKETASKVDRDRGASRSSSLDVVVEEDGEETKGNGRRRRDDDINDSPHNSPSRDIHLPHIDLTKRSSTRKKDKSQVRISCVNDNFVLMLSYVLKIMKLNV